MGSAHDTEQQASLADLTAPLSAIVEIESVILAESRTFRHPACETPPEEVSLQVDVATDLNEESGRIFVGPRFAIIGHRNDDDEEMLRIEAVFIAIYRVPSLKGIQQEHLKAFGELNGLYNLWPYWREFVQSATTRMGFPALTIPVFRPVIKE